MAWWQLSVECSAAELEHTEASMLETGALSITLSDARDEPLYEPLPGDSPTWQHSIVTGLYTQERSLENLYNDLVQLLATHQVASVTKTLIEDQDWERVHLQYFKPIQCAEKLWVVPSWLAAPDPEAINIQLDPGLAFGTGSHPTTALCLAWLGENNLQQQAVIDYGCGSGILAIAACKLGASQVHGVDIDPQALTATQENAYRNEIDTTQLTISLPDQLPDDTVDLLVANILSGPLVELAPRFAALVHEKGKILLSGILKSQAHEIELAYQQYFTLDPVTFSGDWIRISGTRNNV